RRTECVPLSARRRGAHRVCRRRRARTASLPFPVFAATSCAVLKTRGLRMVPDEEHPEADKGDADAGEGQGPSKTWMHRRLNKPVSELAIRVSPNPRGCPPARPFAAVDYGRCPRPWRRCASSEYSGYSVVGALPVTSRGSRKSHRTS